LYAINVHVCPLKLKVTGSGKVRDATHENEFIIIYQMHTDRRSPLVRRLCQNFVAMFGVRKLLGSEKV